MLSKKPAVFRAQHKFQDDVWGQITLNDLERDVIDTPEFQRLFRTSQLGFVDLVYQTANHTRGGHSIGACHIAGKLMSRLMKNTKRARGKDSRYAPIQIAPAERVLIRLGALLHDVSHVPLSHDLERKTHRISYRPGEKPLKLRSHYGHYDKHDDYERNPLLHILLCDESISVLARVLVRYSAPFCALLEKARNDARYEHLQQFLAKLSEAKDAGWDLQRLLLPALLFHLLTYEDPKEAEEAIRRIAVRYGSDDREVTAAWGLGPDRLRNELHTWWYQPFRHDIIGNTLSADLIDYLRRDPRRMGMNRRIDLHLLNYYVLVRVQDTSLAVEADKGIAGSAVSRVYPSRYRCALDVQDQKRGTVRTGLLNDIFRLLDLRHEIHEKAVMHRVVQAANAMLSRALLLLGDEYRLHAAELVGLKKRDHALYGEDTFFKQLLDRCSDPSGDEDIRRRINDARRILLKLVDRRVYRPLMIIPGDRAAAHFTFAKGPGDKPVTAEYRLRTLATIIDSPYYSRFLLFVSACVEKFLQGVFDSDGQLCDHVRRIIHDDALAEQVTDLMPSRVIIWTTPYKQLYKDPGLVVALQKWVGRIDELELNGTDTSPRDGSVVAQVRGSIQDADSKYAALWKLYVFISDGLFYIGTLNKLKECVSGPDESRPAIEQHRSRLKKAQRLVLTAFDAVCRNWSEFCESHMTTEERSEHLNAHMDMERFTCLVDRWISAYRDAQHSDDDPTCGLSTVDVDHYAHDDPIHGSAGHKCRDIRYQVDLPAIDLWDQAKSEENSAGHELVNFLEEVGVRDPEMISELEFQELLEVFDDRETRDHIRSLLRHVAESRPLGAADLKVLWRTGFVWGEREPVSERRERSLFAPDVPSAEGRTQSVPQTRQEIEDWLLRRAEDLDRRVRRQLTTDLDSLVSFIDSVDTSLRPELFENLATRFRNEFRFMHNDIKADEIVNSLQKWLHKRTAPVSGTMSPD